MNENESNMVKFTIDYDILDSIHKRLHDLVEFQLLDEIERKEAKFIVEKLYKENESLKKELFDLKSSISILNEHLLESEKELAYLTTKKAQADSNYEALKTLFENSVNEYDSILINLKKKRLEDAAKMKTLSYLKKYLVSNKNLEEYLNNINEEQNDEVIMNKIFKIKLNCLKLKKFHEKSLKNINQIRKCADRKLDVLKLRNKNEENLFEIAEEENFDDLESLIKFSKICKEDKYLQLTNKTNKPLNIGNWRLNLKDINGNLILDYKFHKATILWPNKCLNIWSSSAKNKIHYPPNDIIMPFGDQDQSLIWETDQVYFNCFLFDQFLQQKVHQVFYFENIRS